MNNTLERVLEATGYMSGGVQAVPSVGVSTGDVRASHLARSVFPPTLHPDAWWHSGSHGEKMPAYSDLRIYFKYSDNSNREQIAKWQREVWNQAFVPLLWIVSAEKVEIYNGFGLPGDTELCNLIRTFQITEDDLAKLDALAGRIAMETGAMWNGVPEVDRNCGVDYRLLQQIGALEKQLVDDGLVRGDAQALIGRSIFLQYLIDGDIVSGEELTRICGSSTLPIAFGNSDSANQLFSWLCAEFNGDMFSTNTDVDEKYLTRIGAFLSGEDMQTGQTSLFPYRFDIIPVELISMIYEQFVHSDTTQRNSHQEGVFYTPATVVSLVLDKVLEDCSGDESVIDLTCGSGVFLVEALRRLVQKKSEGTELTRKLVRHVLYEQIHGVDKSPDAVRVAAFSLYLAALELDPNPQDRRNRKFKPLLGKTIHTGNALNIELPQASFDVIVGNPPWTFNPTIKEGWKPSISLPPRATSIAFLVRALDFVHGSTRIGIVLSATPFFSRSSTGLQSVQQVVTALAPVTLVNLSEQVSWLFPNAKMPAIALFSRCDKRNIEDGMLIINVPWSKSIQRSKTLRLSETMNQELPFQSWHRNPKLLKATFLGYRCDQVLVDHLNDRFPNLGEQLRRLGTSFRTGVTVGKGGNGDASELVGLPVLTTGMRHFHIPRDLPKFSLGQVHRPRQASIYRAPVLLLAENFHGQPRLTTAVCRHDLVYMDTHHGCSLHNVSCNIGYLLSGILSSALATWFYLMTSSAFGIWKRRVIQADINEFPTPDLVELATTDAATSVCAIVKELHKREPTDADWEILDEAIFDLYELNDEDRVVVRDGYLRATWQWASGRNCSVESADDNDLARYADTFLVGMNEWLSASPNASLQAEILDFDSAQPMRIVRFASAESGRAIKKINIVPASNSLTQMLYKICNESNTESLAKPFGLSGHRLYTNDEIVVIKPAARRNWLAVVALEDVHNVIEDSFSNINIV